MTLITKKPTKKKGSYYEGKTARVYDSLHPKELVKQDITISGKLTKIGRQVDVLVEPEQYDNLIIECKDRKRPIDIGQFSPFVVMLEDVRAKRGAMVSNSPYTKSVQNLAKSKSIDLLHLIDTGDPKIAYHSSV